MWVSVPVILACLCCGCNSIKNGWLDPTTVGTFKHDSITSEIRSTLTLEDSPRGIPGAQYPSPQDLQPVVVEYPISAGDTLSIEINELRQRQVPYQTQAQVAAAGYLNLPVVGRIQAVGLTVPELEEAVSQTLRERNVLVDPEVTINPLFLQKATYSIFGIGVSASNDAPLRAGTFPIRRPDLRLLEAINQVGGLNEFITEIYVFRDDAALLDGHHHQPAPSAGEIEPRDFPAVPAPVENGVIDPSQQEVPAEPSRQDERARQSERQNLIDAVEGGRGTEPKAPATGTEPTRAQPERPIDDSLIPEKPQPFLYVNNEFVPNPAYQPQQPENEPMPPRFDTVMAGVNWSRLGGESAQRILAVSADALRNGDPSMNIYVRAGDVIRIISGEIGIYYVMGQVNRVGPFRFESEQITLKAAIASAQGLSGLAWPDRCTVYRRLGQREQIIQVNLDRIFAGLDPDFIVRRGDIINVGTHPFAPFLARIRAWTLPSPVNSVGYSYTYSRNFADIDSYSVRSNPHNEPDRFPAFFNGLLTP
jgi:protein involved in polysaccharide export with SLBB domain